MWLVIYLDWMLTLKGGATACGIELDKPFLQRYIAWLFNLLKEIWELRYFTMKALQISCQNAC